MAGTRTTAVIPRAIPITEVAITTVVIHTVITIPTTAPVIRTLTTDIPIGTTTIQS